MKKFVKHILAIAICAAALLSSCIKEQPYELKIAQLEVAVTRADASSSEEQGDGIGNAMFWVFKCTDLDATGRPTAVPDEVAASWRVMHNVNSSKTMVAHLELPLCDTDHQDYILVAVLNTEAFGSTITLDKNTKFAQLQQALFDASNADFWKRYPSDGGTDVNPDPWKMPVSNWKTFTVSNANTHPSNCYKLQLPVYRAVAKSQLFVKPTSTNFSVTVTDARICSSAMPTNGAILTSNAKGGLTNNTINSAAVYSQQGNAGDDVSVPAVVPDITYTTGAAAKPLHNAYGENDALAFSSVTASADDYTWVGSTFIYENEEALAADTDKYDTAPTGNAGYYMQISYTVSGDSQTYTKYVKLPAVVRNHDYQVKATVDAGGTMTLNIYVNEWDEVEQNMNYENTVTVNPEGQMKWKELPDSSQIPSGGFATDSNGNTIGNAISGGLINMTYAADNYATCTFALDTPVGGTWHAELVTVSGQPGAIQIVEANSGVADNHVADAAKTSISDTGLSASGPISPTGEDGQTHTGLVTLRFRTTVDNTTLTNNVVELRITAEGYWGGKKRTYQVNGLTGLDGISFYKLQQPISVI